MKLTAELLETCTNAKGVHEEDLKVAEVGLKITQQHERTARERKENAEKEYEEMKKDMTACQKNMKDAGVGGIIICHFILKTDNPSERTWPAKFSASYVSLSSSGIKTGTRRVIRPDKQVDVVRLERCTTNLAKTRYELCFRLFKR